LSCQKNWIPTIILVTVTNGSNTYYSIEGSFTVLYDLLCRRVFYVEEYLESLAKVSSVWVSNRAERDTYKRHFNVQVRVQLRTINDMQCVSENESVLLLEGFTLFILTMLSLSHVIILVV